MTIPLYRYTHEYRNDNINATIIVHFTANEVSDAIVGAIGEEYLNEIVAMPSHWYLDDVQSELVA